MLTRTSTLTVEQPVMNQVAMEISCVRRMGQGVEVHLLAHPARPGSAGH